MNAMQDNNILACGKHFPGHGDVSTDSHVTLPIINHSYGHLDTLELFPFKILMNEGLGSIMLAHLFIPSLDSVNNHASSISKKIGTGLLRDTLGFRGLVFSDALNMKGVSAYYETGELEVKAFLAGNDFLLFSENVPLAFESIKKAIEIGTITEERLDESVRRILKAKAFVGLNKYKPVKLQNVTFDLNSDKATLVKRKITENSITLANGIDSLIPFVACLFVGVAVYVPMIFCKYVNGVLLCVGCAEHKPANLLQLPCRLCRNYKLRSIHKKCISFIVLFCSVVGSLPSTLTINVLFRCTLFVYYSCVTFAITTI